MDTNVNNNEATMPNFEIPIMKTKHMKLIIGKEDRTINFIRDTSNAQVDLNLEESKVIIFGSHYEVLLAKQLIHSAIHDGIRLIDTSKFRHFQKDFIEKLEKSTETKIQFVAVDGNSTRVIILANGPKAYFKAVKEQLFHRNPKKSRKKTKRKPRKRSCT